MSDQDEANLEEPDVDHDEPGIEDDEADGEETDILDVSTLSVDEWLRLVFDPPEGKRFTSGHFVTELHRNEYITTIHRRSEEEVIALLERFLVHTGPSPMDVDRLIQLHWAKEHDPTNYIKWIHKFWFKRLEMHHAGHREIPVWEGLTWILDLLPDDPQKALDVIDAYITAHMDHLPDGFVYRLYDSAELIRAKFIGLPGTHAERLAFLSKLSPRDFECLVERLYDAMGYETTLTRKVKDGGRDVIAVRNEPGRQEKLVIECKRYRKTVPAEKIYISEGIRSRDRAYKGVVVTNSRFSVEGRKFANDTQLELIDGEQLVPLLNQHLGARWPTRIEFLVAAAEGRPIYKIGNSVI